MEKDMMIAYFKKLKTNKFDKDRTFYPDEEVKKEIGLKNNESCCDGLGKWNGINKWELAEAKNKRNKNFGIDQMDKVIGSIQSKKVKPEYYDLNIVQGNIILQNLAYLKKFYRIQSKTGKLIPLNSKKEKLLINGKPILVYRYEKSLKIVRLSG